MKKTKAKAKTHVIHSIFQDAKMDRRLYEFELDDIVEELKNSLIEDNDDFIFSITENNGGVAMLLIEPPGKVYINEDARDRLKELWGEAYSNNIVKLTPHFINELTSGRLPVQGIKTVGVV